LEIKRPFHLLAAWEVAVSVFSYSGSLASGVKAERKYSGDGNHAEGKHCGYVSSRAANP
jgi:hypothetical protein